MMGAVQPFLSGAISKTVNVPEETTPEEIEQLYIEGWKLGLKAVAVYRDNCKGSQPLAAAGARPEKPALQPVRRKLPDERVAMTHKFSVEGQEGYVTVGLYEDGKPGELFITMAKEGSTLSGVMDAFATAISLTLQYGVPLEFLVNKFSHVRFEPAGLDQQPPDPLREVDHRLHLPLAGGEVPAARGAGRGRRAAAAERRGHDAGAAAPRQPALPGLELADGGAAVRQPGRRAAVPDLRHGDGAQRRLLQVRQLRHRARLQLSDGRSRAAGPAPPSFPPDRGRRVRHARVRGSTPRLTA